MKSNKQRLLAVVAPLLVIAFLFFGQIQPASADSGQNQPEIEMVQTVVTTTVKVRKTYMAGGQPIAQRSYERAGNVPIDDASGRNNQQRHFIYTDHLGSASTVVNGANGQIEQAARFLPFGEMRDGDDQLGAVTNRGFTGHRENRDIGLTYMNARYYVPGVGRFASADTFVPDPINPQQFNRFSYVTNNPLKFNDPSGHCGADSTQGTKTVTNQITGQETNIPATVMDEGMLTDCLNLQEFILRSYGVSTAGVWSLFEMESLEKALIGFSGYLRGLGNINPEASISLMFKNSTIIRTDEDYPFGKGRAVFNTTSKNIFLGNGTFYESIKGLNGRAQLTDGLRDINSIMETIIHEIIHLWDFNQNRALSIGLENAIGGEGVDCNRNHRNCKSYISHSGQPIFIPGGKQAINRNENLAWALSTFIANPNDYRDAFNNSQVDLYTPYFTRQTR